MSARLGRTLEQVFLRPRAGGVEALVVIEVETGARERLTLPFAGADLAGAARALGRHLARTGSVDRAHGHRLRVERKESLADDAALAGVLVDAFAAERRRGGPEAP